MQVKYVIIITIILLFLCLNLSDNNQKVEKMNSTIRPFDNQSSNLIIPKLKLLKSGEKIEILDLPYCKKDFKVEYGTNINYILNDGKKIYQDILKPNEQQAFIDAKKQGLTQVSWKKSIFTYNNKKVPLELQLTHLDSKTGKITKIIYPLSLESDTKENFSNLSKKNKKLAKKNKKRAKKILDEKGKLSLLLQKPSDIPSLIKGQVNTGKIKSFNVCDDEKYYIEQNKFFMAESPNNETILIAKPIKFDKQLGLTILKNLGESDNDFIKP
jgi:hypothetical protein